MKCMHMSEEGNLKPGYRKICLFTPTMPTTEEMFRAINKPIRICSADKKGICNDDEESVDVVIFKQYNSV